MEGRPSVTENVSYINNSLRGPSNKSEDLTVFVQNLLQQMTDRFTSMSSKILGRIDELGMRIDELEKQIEDMVQNTSAEEGQQHQLHDHQQQGNRMK